MVSCPLHGQGEQEDVPDDNGCCDDTTDLVKSESQQLFQSTGIDLELTPVLIATIFVALHIELSALDTRSLHYFNYKPPLIVCHLPVSPPTFLC